MKQKTKVFLGILAVGLVIALVFLMIFPVSFNINREMVVQRADMQDPAEFEYINLTVSGRYSFRLFRNDTFSGTIAVEGYDFTAHTQTDTVINRFPNILTFYRYSGRGRTAYVLGDARIGFLFRSFDLIVYNRDDIHDFTGGYISPDASKNVFISYPTASAEVLTDRYRVLLDEIRQMFED